MKKILILGATGLIGQHFIRAFGKAFDISVVSTKEKRAAKLLPGCKCYGWDNISKRGFVDKFEVVINLAGANIGAKRWSNRRKRLLLSSRVQTTRSIVNAILMAKSPPRLLNASAIGVYGFHPLKKDQMLYSFDEDTEVDHGHSTFSRELVCAWENEVNRLAEKNLSCACLRFGIVLAPWGGALKKMMGPYHLGLGGQVGTGTQPMSWVHINDCVRAIYFLIAKPNIVGPVNVVAPEVVSNKTFSQALSSVLSTPNFLWKPSLLIWLMFGEMGRELLLNGQYVRSKVLKKNGFTFTHPQLREALQQLVN